MHDFSPACVCTLPRLLTRGYTGHEHLDAFGLINMNGRLYDPVVGMFLSPDPYVQAPGYALNYNRYAYCLNNPLMYADPSGEFILGTIFTLVWDFCATVFVNGGIDPWNTPENRAQAWTNFDPSAEWSKTSRAFEIDMGGFKTDENRTLAGRFLQILSRWTWELPQTLLGKTVSHTRNFTGGADEVSYYGGATLVNNVDNGDAGHEWGFTLGSYINSKNMTADPYNDEMFRHEYGHTLQSRLTGPLYLAKVGLPSLISAALDYLNWFNHNHDRSWFETQANRMSYRYFMNHHPEALSSTPTRHGSGRGGRQPTILTGTPWDDEVYPRKYNPTWYWIFSVPFPFWLFF